MTVAIQASSERLPHTLAAAAIGTDGLLCLRPLLAMRQPLIGQLSAQGRALQHAEVMP